MDTKFISSLIAVVEGGSFAAAARAQAVTPAAISQRIAALEVELNIKLLVRAGRRVEPTPQCLLVIPLFRQMLKEQADVFTALAHEVPGGPLRVGAISTALSDYAPSIVEAVRERAPLADLTIFPGTSKEIYKRFEAGELDAALIVAPPFSLPKSMRFDIVADQRIGLLSPLIDANLPFIAYSRDAWGGELCWEATRALAQSPKVLCELDAVEAIAQMVQDGLGQAVLPEWAGLHQRYSATRFTPCAGASRKVGLLTWRRDDTRAVLEILRDAVFSAAGGHVRFALGQNRSTGSS